MARSIRKRSWQKIPNANAELCCDTSSLVMSVDKQAKEIDEVRGKQRNINFRHGLIIDCADHAQPQPMKKPS